MDSEELFEKLTQEIAEWEHSPYYLPDKELFDLEGFLSDHHAHELKQELERKYGTPLNQSFWASSLSYQRLKRARQEVKAQEAYQDRRRQEYVQAVERAEKARQEWLKEMRASYRRGQFQVIPGGKKESE